ECSPCTPGAGPVAALVVADVAMTLLLAGGAFCLARRGRAGGRAKPRPPAPEPTYQELQGARGDLYSSLRP
ncbi:TYOBP protein, partial [Penelope pileata]|nr:TYOBP protein [Penelope pileata]